MNGPTKLDFYITLRCKDSLGPNTLAYWDFIDYDKNEGYETTLRVEYHKGFTLESSMMHSQILD
jgi:hypothetical protein